MLDIVAMRAKRVTASWSPFLRHSAKKTRLHCCSVDVEEMASYLSYGNYFFNVILHGVLIIVLRLKGRRFASERCSLAAATKV